MEARDLTRKNLPDSLPQGLEPGSPGDRESMALEGVGEEDGPHCPLIHLLC